MGNWKHVNESFNLLQNLLCFPKIVLYIVDEASKPAETKRNVLLLFPLFPSQGAIRNPPPILSSVEIPLYQDGSSTVWRPVPVYVSQIVSCFYG